MNLELKKKKEFIDMTIDFLDYINLINIRKWPSKNLNSKRPCKHPLFLLFIFII